MTARKVRVKHMVCPACAQMHGNEHLAGCPESFDASPDYRLGWFAASAALVQPYADRVLKLRDENNALRVAQVKLDHAENALHVAARCSNEHPDGPFLSQDFWTICEALGLDV